jgi:hypothetical protein
MFEKEIAIPRNGREDFSCRVECVVDEAKRTRFEA